MPIRIDEIDMVDDGYKTRLQITLIRSGGWTSVTEPGVGDLPADFRERLLRWLQEDES